ncbi:DNA polymerase III subunit gamma and tau, partial [Geodermatophilus sp. CPCC 205761]|uniref:DNA polymerase III subunit gamma and tau n=1 Tax=Geodermatophilus sp. CPCC 205761 TaxID=2936597 RepID=UPI003EEE9E3C
MALALYRKYRPATFAEVVGQEHVTTPLVNAVDGGRINHAYLFSGPRGCGKTSSARILARSLNCEQGPTSTPCGVCGSCVALAPDGPGSLDVIEIDAASHGGVDDARDLRERAFFAPVSSRYKVYIVDEAHMVTTQGFNALLKVVEEPPEFLVFVFATTEPDKVLPTIRSRTHHYPFRLVPPTTLRGLLEKTCAAEGVQVEATVFPLVVRAGGGSVRDSLSILDQLLAGAGPEGVTYKSAVGLLGVTDDALLDETIDALAAHDAPAVFRAVDRVVEAGHDPRRFATDLLDRMRDLIVLDAVPDAGGNGLLDCPPDRLDLMSSQARALGSATLSRMADTVHEGLTEMRGTTAPRLLLELVCARMLLPATDDSAAATLQRLERLERRMSIAGEHAGRPVAEAAVREAPVREAPVREAAVREAPVREAPVREAPVREAPVREAPARPEPAGAPAPDQSSGSRREFVRRSQASAPAPSAPAPSAPAAPPVAAPAAATEQAPSRPPEVDGWPETTLPGSGAPARPAPAAAEKPEPSPAPPDQPRVAAGEPDIPLPPEPTDDEDWPHPARPAAGAAAGTRVEPAPPRA